MKNRYYGHIETVWGLLTAGLNAHGAIFGLWFESQKYFPSLSTDTLWIDGGKEKGDIPQAVLETFNKLKDQMQAYENGEIDPFDLPLEPEGTDFRKDVWKRLMDIAPGETTTYGALANQVAAERGLKSMSAQAVGGAVGHNPISIIIPCHRVVGAKGELTGYAGGLERKSALLEHEGGYAMADIKGENQ